MMLAALVAETTTLKLLIFTIEVAAQINAKFDKQDNTFKQLCNVSQKLSRRCQFCELGELRMSDSFRAVKEG
jgi:hypothetical protein